MSNAPSKPVSFSRPKVGYFSNRPRMQLLENMSLLVDEIKPKPTVTSSKVLLLLEYSGRNLELA